MNVKEGWGATGVLYRMGLTLIGSEARDYVLRYGNDNYAFGSMRKRYQAIARRINKRLCDKYEVTLEFLGFGAGVRRRGI